MKKQNGQFHSVVLSLECHFCSACSHWSACEALSTTGPQRDPGATSTVDAMWWLGVLPDLHTAFPSQQNCKCFLGSSAIAKPGMPSVPHGELARRHASCLGPKARIPASPFQQRQDEAAGPQNGSVLPRAHRRQGRAGSGP